MDTRDKAVEDLLALPAKFREFTKRFNERLDNIAQSLTEMNSIAREMSKGLDYLWEDDLEQNMSVRLREQISRFFGLVGARTVWHATGAVYPADSAEDYSDHLEAALDEGQITDDEAGRLIDTDMVMRGVRAEGGAYVYVAVEASGVIRSRDIRRARESAAILSRIHGTEALPAVYGYSIAQQVDEAQADTETGQPEAHIFLETEMP